MERDHDAPASRRGAADRGRAASGRVAKTLLVEGALHQAVQVGVHGDTLPWRAGRRIGEMAGGAESAGAWTLTESVGLAGPSVAARTASSRGRPLFAHPCSTVWVRRHPWMRDGRLCATAAPRRAASRRVASRRG
jgi:hypothetical protein